MVSLQALWLPILLSAVIVFVVSSIIHMVLPWHKNDYSTLADEENVRAAIGPLAIPPGDYMIPRPSSTADLKSPAFLEKMNKGPVMFFTVLPNGPTSMGRNLVLWFLNSVVIGIFGAYVTGRALGPGTDYLQVFRFVSTVTFLGYAVALWQMSIWYRRSWWITFKVTVDGLIYALLTAGTFGWLWPR